MLLTKDEMATEESSLRKEERKYVARLSSISKRMKMIVRNERSPDKAIASLYRFIESDAFKKTITTETGNILIDVQNDRIRMFRKAASKSKGGKTSISKTTVKKSEMAEVRSKALAQAVIDAKNSFKSAVETLDAYSKVQQSLDRIGKDIISNMVDRIENVVGYRLRLLARHEIANASNGFDRLMSNKIGSGLYVWTCIHDDRTRTAHNKMDGVLCAWNDAPNPEQLFGGYDTNHGYHPGGTYNCRCTAIPVISNRDIVFPIRFHKGGNIVVIRNYWAFRWALFRNR